MARSIGILTAGGDSPGLNAAIRSIARTSRLGPGYNVIGFTDGFKGLMQNRCSRLERSDIAGILIRGGTILGTSRAKVHRMKMGDGTTKDMRPMMKQVVEQHGLEALICLGGGGTAKNALRLHEVGVPVIALPKTIDNDVSGSDYTFGFDTAMGVATEAIDRLHSTAHSHHRIMVVEVMGHNAGWLTLGAGVAGGADVILIPEIPYNLDIVAEAIQARKSGGRSFSIVAVAEGALADYEAKAIDEAKAKLAKAKKQQDKASAKAARARLAEIEVALSGLTDRLSSNLERLTGLESRVTILGHVQRGGAPTPADRLLATRLGAAAVDAVVEGDTGVMIGVIKGETVRTPLAEVAGKRKTVPLDHPWIKTARSLGIGLGD